MVIVVDAEGRQYASFRVTVCAAANHQSGLGLSANGTDAALLDEHALVVLLSKAMHRE